MLCATVKGGLEAGGFGIVFVEAAACGVPSVARAQRGVRTKRSSMARPDSWFRRFCSTSAPVRGAAPLGCSATTRCGREWVPRPAKRGHRPLLRRARRTPPAAEPGRPRNISYLGWPSYLLFFGRMSCSARHGSYARVPGADRFFAASARTGYIPHLLVYLVAHACSLAGMFDRSRADRAPAPSLMVACLLARHGATPRFPG